MTHLLPILLITLFALPLILFLIEGLIISRLPRTNALRRWWVKHLSDSLSE
jgi:hypothetical protein